MPCAWVTVERTHGQLVECNLQGGTPYHNSIQTTLPPHYSHFCRNLHSFCYLRFTFYIHYYVKCVFHILQFKDKISRIALNVLAQM
jgi:hypothetical protein